MYLRMNQSIHVSAGHELADQDGGKGDGECAPETCPHEQVLVSWCTIKVPPLRLPHKLNRLRVASYSSLQWKCPTHQAYPHQECPPPSNDTTSLQSYSHSHPCPPPVSPPFCYLDDIFRLHFVWICGSAPSHQCFLDTHQCSVSLSTTW